MKTQDFMDALGGINEKYLKDLLEEPSESAAGGLISVSEDSDQKAVAAPEPERGAKPIVSGIFRYLVFAASAAACIGGIALLVKLGNQKINMTSGDSQPVPVTEITDITSQTTASAVTFTGTEQTTLTDTTSDVLSETNTVTELTEETTTDSAESSAETVTELTTETTTEFVTDTERTRTETTAEQTVKTSAENSTTTVTFTVPPETESMNQITRTSIIPSNSIRVNCLDLLTYEPVNGVKVSLIERPNHEAEQIASWVSDSIGGYTIGGLSQIGTEDDPPYMLRIEQIPEGYVGGYEKKVILDFIYGHTEEINCYFLKLESPHDFSMTVQDENGVTLPNDLATYSVVWEYPWNKPDVAEREVPSATIYSKIKLGDMIALPDGQYYAILDKETVEKKGYSCNSVYKDGYLFGYMIPFYIEDGVVDRELIFTVEKDPFFISD